MKNRLYILTGWGQKITEPQYKTLINSVKDNFEVIELDWGSRRDRRYLFGKDRSFAQVVAEVKKQIKTPSKNDSILGFSVGAAVAYQVATQLKFRNCLICSISPILGEDIFDDCSNLTSEQIAELAKIKFKAPKTDAFFVFRGAKEWPSVLDLSARLINDFVGTLITIKNTKHQLSPIYIREIKKWLV